MKATETKSSHSQQHATAKQPFFNQGQENTFFSERPSEYRPFFPFSSTSSFIQPKYAPEHKPFFQPAAVPFIQAKCATCEAEERKQQKEQSAETLTVQRMPAFESDEETFESSEDKVVQRQTLPHAEAITPTAVSLQPKCATCEVEEKDQSQ